MMSRRLVFVLNDLSFFLSHRFFLAKAAAQAGYQVHVVAPQSPLSNRLRDHDFHFHAIPLSRKGRNLLREMRLIYVLCRLYRRLRPDVVHHLTIKPVLYGGIASRLMKVPAVVSTLTGLGYLFIARSRMVGTLRWLSLCCFYFVFRHSNLRVIFQNTDDQYQFVKYRLISFQNSVLIRGSGVPLQFFQPLPFPRKQVVPIVLLASRLLWDKGVGEFVKAAQWLRRYYRVRMVLAGPLDLGNPSGISQNTLSTWVQAGVIEYWGFQKDIRRAFADCHIVCLTSYREGLPRVLLEAAACGRPMIATNVPGCREVVVHRKNGLLIPAGDACALAYAVVDLIKNRDLWARMGQYGRRLVEAHFSIDRVNRDTLSIYDALS